MFYLKKHVNINTAITPKHRDSLSQYDWLFLSVYNHTEFFILEQRYDSMTTSIVENCPNCGKENQYAMGSCRNCGTERSINRLPQYSPPGW
jgi:hypothetical protein